MLIDQFIEEEQFHHFFQPIFDVKGMKKIGFEILLRSNVFENPEQAFQAAKEANRLYDLDTRSIHNALSTYQESLFPDKGQLLFINVFPSTLSNPSFNSFLDQLTTKLALSSKRIVLEISESELIDHPDNFLQHLQLLKQQGFTIALDDVGKGYANFNMLIKMEPDYIKLDRLFSNQLDISKQKQGLIRFFLSYCHDNQVELVLEGIETKAEMQMAQQLGIPYAQGFYLGRPAPSSKWITVHT